MKYRNFTKEEKKLEKQKWLEDKMSGSGLYLYRNNTKSEMKLPRPTKSGRRELGVGEEFQGDNYYMEMVRMGLLRLVRVLQTPEQELQSKLQEEQIMLEQKLLLDQPDTVTYHGKVEHVVQQPKVPVKQLNEKNNEDMVDILLNEGPCEDGFVIVDK